MTTTEPEEYRIEIANSQKCIEIDEAFLLEVASRTLAEEDVVAAEISLAIVDDPTIHHLNRRFLAHDEPTDVLSFLLASPDPPSATTDSRGASRSGSRSAGCRGAGKTLEGEVIASAETAVRRAADFAWSPHDELVLYIVHGLLHLAGYDDLTPAEKRLMRRRERAILALWGLTPSYRRRRSSTARRAAQAGGVSGAHP